MEKHQADLDSVEQNPGRWTLGTRLPAVANLRAMKRPRHFTATVRTLRGAALGAATAAIGIAAHVAGGGEVPGTGPTLGIAVLVAWAGTALADRQRGPAATVAALALGQAMLHAVLVLPSGFGQPELPAGTGTVGLPAEHAVAVLLMGLLLAWADDVFLAALRLVRVVLRRFRTRVPARAPLWVPVLPAFAYDGAKDVLLRRTRSRRGPPLFG